MAERKSQHRQVPSGKSNSVLSVEIDAPEAVIVRPENSQSTDSIFQRAESTETWDAQKLQELGRMRPEYFASLWIEILFVTCIALSQLLAEYFTSGFTVLAPFLSKELNISKVSSTWLTNAFVITVSAFLLPLGRLGDIYGGLPVYCAGCLWVSVWSIIAGFCGRETTFVLCRAMQGIGTAATLSSGINLLGNCYRPGPRKNIVFSIYGAMAPIGFFLGLFVAGLVTRHATWPWYLWIGAIVVIPMAVTSFMLVNPRHISRKSKDATMDWLGSIGTVTGSILLIFSLTQSTHAPQGWRTPYIYVSFVASIVTISATFYFEGWVSNCPLIPFQLLAVKHLRPLMLALLLGYGTIGIFMLYSNLYIQNVMGVETTRLIAWYAPMAAVGTLLALLGGCLLHLIPGTVMLIIPGLGTIVASLLLALAPAKASYWAWIFPAMICATISIDVMFTVTNVFLSTNLPADRQGFAGSIANLLLYFSISLLLACADMLASWTANQGLRRSYQNVFWFEMSCGITMLVVLVAFVRIRTSVSDFTLDEKRVTAALEGSAKLANQSGKVESF